MVGGYVGFDFFAESLSSFAKKDWKDCCRFREAEPCKKTKTFNYTTRMAKQA